MSRTTISSTRWGNIKHNLPLIGYSPCFNDSSLNNTKDKISHLALQSSTMLRGYLTTSLNVNRYNSIEVCKSKHRPTTCNLKVIHSLCVFTNTCIQKQPYTTRLVILVTSFGFTIVSHLHTFSLIKSHTIKTHANLIGRRSLFIYKKKSQTFMIKYIKTIYTRCGFY